MLLIALLPIVICIWIALAKKYSFLPSVQLSCIGCALFVLIMLVTLYLSTGKDIISFYLDQWKQLFQQNDTLTIALYNALQSVSGAAQSSQISPAEAYKTVYPLFETGLKVVIPTIFTAFIPLGGLAFYLLARALVKKAGGQVIRIPAFADFKLPPKFGRWSILILIVSWIGQTAGWRNFDFVLTISFALFGSIYYVQGMALVEWGLKKHIKAPAGRAAIILLIAILLFQFFIYIYIGIFEQLVKIRQRASLDKGTL